MTRFLTTRAGRVVTNGALLLASATLTLAALEVGVRILRVGVVREHQLFMSYHPVLGWAKTPNKTGIHATSEYRITERMNSEGIRGPEYSRVKHPGEYRILVLGDSVAEGYTVEFDDLFSEVLKRRLNQRHGSRTSYEVINTGTGGYSTDQELLLFQMLGKTYEPDLTILLFVENDVFYNNSPTYSRGHKPLFRRDGDGIRLTNVPVPPPWSNPRPSQPSVLRAPATRLKAWLREHSQLYALMAERIHQFPVLYKLALSLRLITPDSSEGPVPRELGIWRKVYDPTIREAWDITEALLRALRDETSFIGSELLVFYVSSRALVYPESWPATRARYRLSDLEWSPGQVEIELSAICHRLGIRLINPTERFAAEANQLRRTGQFLYFPVDGHWNAHGHRLAGEILADYVASALPSGR